jgi:hypothetical protein
VDPGIVAQLISIIPTVLWVALIVAVILIFRPTIQAQLIPRMTGLKVFGIEATFVKEQLDRAAETVPAGSQSDRNQVSRRAERIASLSAGFSPSTGQRRPGRDVLCNAHPTGA